MGKRHGIVLITTMFFVIIIVMISTLIATQGKMALLSGTVSMQAEEAHMAALSGIDFVRGCLKTDKSFGTDKSSIKSLALNRGIKIDIDDKQNITGYMGANRLTSNNTTVENTSASKARFYISFDADNPKNCKYPSVNNLLGVNLTQFDSLKNKYRRNVEANTVYVVSKGVCGKCVRYVETVLTNDGNAVLDGATTIGGAVNMTGIYDYSEDLPMLKITHKDSNYFGSLNTFGGAGGNSDTGGNSITINTKSGNGNNYIEELLDLDNKVSINASSLEIGNKNFKSDNNDKKENLINTKDSLNAVENEIKGLDSIDKAKSSLLTMVNENTTKIPGGTYIYLKDTTINGLDDEGNTPYYWVYIPSNKSSDDIDGYINEAIDKLKLDDMNNMKPKKVSEMLSDKNGIKFGGTNGKDLSRSVVVSNDLTLDVDGGSNLNFVSINKIRDEVGNITYEQSNTTIDFQIKDNKSILNEKGSLNIVGEVTGSGNIISNGNVSFNAGSTLETDQNSKVAIWANNNINIGRAKNLSSKTTEGAVFSSRVANSNNVDHGDEADEIKAELENQKNNPISYYQPIEEEQNTQTPNAYYFDQNLGCVIKSEDNSKKEIVNIKSEINECLSRNYNYYTSYYNNYYSASTFEYFNSYAERHPECYNQVPYPIAEHFQTGEYWKHEDFGLLVDHPMYNIYPRKGSANDFDVFYTPNNDRGPYYYVGAFTIDNEGGNFSINFDSDITAPNLSDSHDLNYRDLQRRYENKNEPLINSSSQTTSDSSSNTIVNLQNNKKSAKNIVANGTSFIGTLYSSKGKINIDAGNADFNVKGSIITLKNGLNIDNAKYINLTYDPNYVPFFKDKGINTGIKFMSEFI